MNAHFAGQVKNRAANSKVKKAIQTDSVTQKGKLLRVGSHCFFGSITISESFLLNPSSSTLSLNCGRVSRQNEIVEMRMKNTDKEAEEG